MKNLYLPLLICFLLSFVGTRAQVSVLNSYPSSSAAVYLDFDGHYLNGTSWNMAGPITCGPSNLSTIQITEIFNRVAEDYRPFNINVTTDSTKYWAAPATKRMRIVLTITSDWYGAAGGVSYVNSFSWGDNTPAFVFTTLLNFSAKNIAEATSHEIGHTLGLRHQSSYDGNCIKTAEYNVGTGNGEIGWAPIMGVGYYRNFTLWNNGANPYGCTSYQDDLSIITSSSNGFGYRSDDHGNNTGGSATTASFTNNQFNVNGVVEKINDLDVFKFTIPTLGYFHLDAVPYNIGTGNNGSNLDLQVELLGSGQSSLGIYNPGNSLNSTIDTMLNPGTYYLRVQGKGNIYAPEYASLGSYSLNGNFSEGSVLPVHKLELHGSTENNRHIFNWVIEADEKVSKQILEVSTNGRNFQTAGTLSIDARAFNYIPGNNGLLQYRLNVTFENGKQYYSNVVAIPYKMNAMKPFIQGNMVQNEVLVNSPESFNYSIYDHNGRMVAKGNINEGINHIEAGSFGRGMYIIQFNNQQNHYTERFVKQ